MPHDNRFTTYNTHRLEINARVNEDGTTTVIPEGQIHTIVYRNKIIRTIHSHILNDQGTLVVATHWDTEVYPGHEDGNYA